MVVENLGTIVAMRAGTTAPTNTQIIWLDTSEPIPLHKAYNPTTAEWEPFIYLTLIDNSTIKRDGDGKLYVDQSTISALTIADGSIALVKLANVASGTVFYRKTTGTGSPETQTLATLKADLGLTGTNSGDQDLSGLVTKSTTINNKPLSSNVSLSPTDIGSPSGSGTSTGTNTGDETKASIKTKLEITVLEGDNTGDETYDSIVELFGLEGEGYTLMPTSQLEKLQGIGGQQVITLPSATTVAGRISGAVEGTNYPTGWILSVGTSEYDLSITHNLGKKISNVNIFTVDGTGQERMLRPFNNAYSGIVTPNSNSVLIEALTDIQLQIKIYLTFA